MSICWSHLGSSQIPAATWLHQKTPAAPVAGLVGHSATCQSCDNACKQPTKHNKTHLYIYKLQASSQLRLASKPCEVYLLFEPTGCNTEMAEQGFQLIFTTSTHLNPKVPKRPFILMGNNTNAYHRCSWMPEIDRIGFLMCPHRPHSPPRLQLRLGFGTAAIGLFRRTLCSSHLFSLVVPSSRVVQLSPLTPPLLVGVRWGHPPSSADDSAQQMQMGSQVL